MDDNDDVSSGISFSDVFDRMAGRTFDLGGDYLTLKGQEAIAKAQLDAQVRLNGYAKVNPSLGPVSPGAAAVVASKTPAASWLPFGMPIAGTTGTTAAPNGGSYVPMIVGATILVVVLLFVVRLFRK